MREEIHPHRLMAVAGEGLHTFPGDSQILEVSQPPRGRGLRLIALHDVADPEIPQESQNVGPIGAASGLANVMKKFLGLASVDVDFPACHIRFLGLRQRLHSAEPLCCTCCDTQTDRDNCKNPHTSLPLPPSARGKIYT